MLISRLTDAMLACPFLILAIALAAFLGPSLTNAMIAIGVSATPVFVRLTRGADARDQGRGLRRGGARDRQPAAGASRCATCCRTSFRALIVQATLAIAAAVIAEASLSFLGLGQQPPAPSWGSMLNTAKNYIDNAPWMAIWPGAVDLRARAVVQPARRRPARRARSAARLSLVEAGSAEVVVACGRSRDATPDATQTVTPVPQPVRPMSRSDPPPCRLARGFGVSVRNTTRCREQVGAIRALAEGKSARCARKRGSPARESKRRC